MDIKVAEFVTSTADYKKCPPPKYPEFAFIGRSNVGKSSLINMLTGKKGLAKTSSTPGKTQLINHFLINKQWYLVDLPGYGYAKVSKAQRDKWQKMIKGYLENRQNLHCIFILVDGRISFQQSDHDMISWMGANGIPFVIVITKADKVTQRELMQNIKGMKETLKAEWERIPHMIITSSKTQQGRNQLLDFIESCF
ncbi:MAG: ribosome biogenesis GTP-binding protein YihA/YsxC [Flavobacteriales bacterium]|nr:ribosome biogenesis GTP-binding protein YihA/YsxC [Flavobacteriales bacterium]